ncbi:hypothetical protein FQN52_004009 [Onygenales sp. PD_12]|nr:hypothetical protein FQN52_004009 [Onygenales sp. PD_12]
MDVDSLPAFQVIPYQTTLPTGLAPANSPTDGIRVKLTSSWTYCGPLIALPDQNLPPSFHTWAEQTIYGSLLPYLTPFLAFVHQFLARNNLSHYWLTIKATRGTDEFDMPRWHTDDLFYKTDLQKEAATSKPRKGKTMRRIGRAEKKSTNLLLDPSNIPDETKWKLATTLLGPGTLFLTSPIRARAMHNNIKQSIRDQNKDHVCPTVHCVGCATAAESVRVRLAEEFRDYNYTQAQAGECTFFRVGDEEGAVHSEPSCHGDRIFVNVVPGGEEELRGLMRKWGMEFPRAWCVNLPLQIGVEASVRDVW